MILNLQAFFTELYGLLEGNTEPRLQDRFDALESKSQILIKKLSEVIAQCVLERKAQMSQRSECKSNRSSISSVRSNTICGTADAAAIRTKLKYIGPESKVRAELETLQAKKGAQCDCIKVRNIKARG